MVQGILLDHEGHHPRRVVRPLNAPAGPLAQQPLDGWHGLAADGPACYSGDRRGVLVAEDWRDDQQARWCPADGSHSPAQITVRSGHR